MPGQITGTILGKFGYMITQGMNTFRCLATCDSMTVMCKIL